MIMRWVSAQTDDQLDRLYYCQSCGRTFLFREDKEDHKLESGHATFIVFTLDGTLFDSS